MVLLRLRTVRSRHRVEVLNSAVCTLLMVLSSFTAAHGSRQSRAAMQSMCETPVSNDGGDVLITTAVDQWSQMSCEKDFDSLDATYEIYDMEPADPADTTSHCNYTSLRGIESGLGIYWNPVYGSIMGTPTSDAIGHCKATVVVRPIYTPLISESQNDDHDVLAVAANCSTNATKISTKDLANEGQSWNYTTYVNVLECNNQSCKHLGPQYYCDHLGSKYDNSWSCECDCANIDQTADAESVAYEAIIPSLLLALAILVVVIAVKNKRNRRRLKRQVDRYMWYLPDFALPVPDKMYEIHPSDLEFSNESTQLGEGQFGKVVLGRKHVHKHNHPGRLVAQLLTMKRAHSPSAGSGGSRGSAISSSSDVSLHEATSKFVPVAIKMCNKPSLNSDEVNAFLAEAVLMKGLEHENVVRLVGEVTQKKSKEGHICIVLEYCEGGDLLTFVRRKRPQLSVDGNSLEQEGLSVSAMMELAAGAANGVAYLHEVHSIIHRDLAARNCLVAFDEGRRAIVKISDFGLSRRIDQKDNTFIEKHSGHGNHGAVYIPKNRNAPLPVRWMALEALVSLQFSFATDVWSLSVVFYEIFSFGTTPYEMSTNSEVISLVMNSQRLGQPQQCPDDVYLNVMLPSWSDQPDARPSGLNIATRLTHLVNSIAQNPDMVDAIQYPGKCAPQPSTASRTSTAGYEVGSSKSSNSTQGYSSLRIPTPVSTSVRPSDDQKIYVETPTLRSDGPPPDIFYAAVPTVIPNSQQNLQSCATNSIAPDNPQGFYSALHHMGPTSQPAGSDTTNINVDSVTVNDRITDPEARSTMLSQFSGSGDSSWRDTNSMLLEESLRENDALRRDIERLQNELKLLRQSKQHDSNHLGGSTQTKFSYSTV